MGTSNIKNYFSRFDSNGRILASVPIGTTLEKTKRSAYETEGYCEIPAEDWHYYIGNHGQGDNGTGYIRDPKTGKPVSAPPAPPVEVEPQEPPVDEERLAAFEAMAAQEARLVAQGERIAALEAELSALKGGEGK